MLVIQHHFRMEDLEDQVAVQITTLPPLEELEQQIRDMLEVTGAVLNHLGQVAVEVVLVALPVPLHQVLVVLVELEFKYQVLQDHLPLNQVGGQPQMIQIAGVDLQISHHQLVDYSVEEEVEQLTLLVTPEDSVDSVVVVKVQVLLHLIIAKTSGIPLMENVEFQELVEAVVVVVMVDLESLFVGIRSVVLFHQSQKHLVVS